MKKLLRDYTVEENQRIFDSAGKGKPMNDPMFLTIEVQVTPFDILCNTNPRAFLTIDDRGISMTAEQGAAFYAWYEERTYLLEEELGTPPLQMGFLYTWWNHRVEHLTAILSHPREETMFWDNRSLSYEKTKDLADQERGLPPLVWEHQPIDEGR